MMLKKIISFVKSVKDSIVDKFVYVAAMNHFNNMQTILKKEELTNPILVNDIQELKRLKQLMENYRDNHNGSSYNMTIDQEYDIHMFYKAYEYLLTKRLVKLLEKEKSKYKL